MQFSRFEEGQENYQTLLSAKCKFRRDRALRKAKLVFSFKQLWLVLYVKLSLNKIMVILKDYFSRIL